MKVIILAGGWSTRLGRVTDLIPKPMVKIGSKPILWHIMKIYSHYGYKDFIICLGVKGEIIKSFFYNYNVHYNNFTINFKNEKIKFHDFHDKLDWRVSLIDTGLNTLKGGRIKRIEKYIDPDMNMLTYGDGLADIDINDLIKYHKSHGKTLTITGVHKPSRFGELYEIEGKLIKFKEKPQSSIGIINGGFMVFNNSLLDYLNTDETCDFEHVVLEELVKKGEVMVYKHNKHWDCMDDEVDIDYLNKLWNTNNAFWKVWM